MSVFILWSCQADPAAVANACPIGPILFSVHVFQKARLFTSRKVLMNLFMLFLFIIQLVGNLGQHAPQSVDRLNRSRHRRLDTLSHF